MNSPNMKKCLFTVLLHFCTAIWCFGQDDFALGEDLFMHNKPHEAVVYFENAVAGDSAPVKALLYLGMVYEQLDRTDEAIAVYERAAQSAMDQAGDLTANVANNLGNAYFRKGSTADAELWYTRALEADQVYAPAYLGRANVHMKTGELKAAIADYEQYVQLEPRARQKADIERLVAFIKAEFAEAERKQRLLDEVSASLQSAADASQGLSSGAENVEGYAGEFELE